MLEEELPHVQGPLDSQSKTYDNHPTKTNQPPKVQDINLAQAPANGAVNPVPARGRSIEIYVTIAPLKW